ncbi:hypothetical protein VSH64_47590 [Amycolatopsis rhabdoformis]|uniref:DUF2892 domain-containing protein n=1 Tax=Amycolatopsis rhabdoformis TaxID=1448059 RepID=A0ABZ1I7H9_9PSEU|nr:hypothetical protein [Amycolatopsis rhabdoformis]WSE30373.1 hypothetical protein VSH64_47590 [Amycolatopsis rhabdoformis]
MAKPTPLQMRNALAGLLMAAGFVWNLLVGGQWWLGAIFAVGTLLSVASIYLNRPGANS